MCVQDFAYHGLAAFFYLSAGVDLAYITLGKKSGQLRIYQIDIAAVVRTDLKTAYQQLQYQPMMFFTIMEPFYCLICFSLEKLLFTPKITQGYSQQLLDLKGIVQHVGTYLEKIKRSIKITFISH